MNFARRQKEVDRTRLLGGAQPKHRKSDRKTTPNTVTFENPTTNVLPSAGICTGYVKSFLIHFLRA